MIDETKIDRLVKSLGAASAKERTSALIESYAVLAREIIEVLSELIEFGRRAVIAEAILGKKNFRRSLIANGEEIRRVDAAKKLAALELDIYKREDFFRAMKVCGVPRMNEASKFLKTIGQRRCRI